MKFIIEMGPVYSAVRFLQCDVCKTVEADRVEDIKKRYEIPTDYDEILDWAPLDVYIGDLPIEIIIREMALYLCEENETEYIEIESLYKKLETGNRENIDRATAKETMDLMLSSESPQIEIKDGKIKSLISFPRAELSKAQLNHGTKPKHKRSV